MALPHRRLSSTINDMYLTPNVLSSADSDQMIFGPFDFEDSPFAPDPTLDSWSDLDQDFKPSYDFSPPPSSAATSYGFNTHSFPSSFGSPPTLPNPSPLDSKPFDNFHLSNWVNDQDCPPSATSPIPIPSCSGSTNSVPYPDPLGLSPIGFAALHSLPASVSPSLSSFDTCTLPFPRQRVDSFESSSSQDPSSPFPTPAWASHLWDSQHTSLRSPSSPRQSFRHSPMADSTQRPRAVARFDSAPTSLLLASSSAPSSAPTLTRSYSRRAESASTGDEGEVTIRRKKLSGPDKPNPSDNKQSTSPPLKSSLKVPKLAPSAWQLYFTDWIQQQQATTTRKLNVAQAAKEAGAEYANLTPEEKEPYKRKSQAAKEAREREHNAYMRSLTPDDIKRENVFRAAQRKAGKSRKSNLKDPNAPKKPLSAYFMFLQRIRSDHRLVQEIFGDESETTKQSVLAAAKWRSMTDDERKPFLAQAEQEKMEYEAARRMYEEGTTGYGQSINFSILPPGSTFSTIKVESETEEDPPDKVVYH